MRRLIPLLLVLLVASFGWAKSITDTKDDMNAIFVPWFLNDVVDAQEAYFDTHGTYAQCVQSTNVPVTVTADVVLPTEMGDRLTEALHDQAEACATIFSGLDVPLPYTVWMYSKCDRNNGAAYTTCADVLHDGTLYRRCQHTVRQGTGDCNGNGVQWTCAPTCTGWPGDQFSWMAIP